MTGNDAHLVAPARRVPSSERVPWFGARGEIPEDVTRAGTEAHLAAAEPDRAYALKFHLSEAGHRPIGTSVATFHPF